MDDVHELKLRLERDEYEIDPELVAEALLDRVDPLWRAAEGRDERLSRRGARGPSGPGPDGPRDPAA